MKRTDKTMQEYARNEDGTYDGAKALAWMGEALCGKPAMTETEIKDKWTELAAGKKDKEDATK